MRDKILELLKKRVDLEGLGADILVELLKPMLEKFVKESDNPYDDMLVAALMPVLEKELKDKLKSLVAKLYEALEEE